MTTRPPIIRRRPGLWGLIIAGRGAIALSTVAALAYAGTRIMSAQAAYGGSTTPRCVPHNLNRSSMLPGTNISVSPLPDSLDSSPRTQISILGAPKSRLREVRVNGSRTGMHSGHLDAYSQGDGASFLPARPFAIGEVVTVTGKLALGTGKRQPFAFHFTVSDPDALKHEAPRSNAPAPPDGSTSGYQSFHSRPELHPPTVTVTSDAPETSAGYVLSAPYTGPGQHGPMIFNSSGDLVWFDPLPANVAATNLQVQSYQGEPVLTWWQGYITPNGFGQGEEIVANGAYEEIAHIRPGSGFEADLHDFHINSNDDTAVITVFNTIHCDLSSVGGPREAAVTGGGFQELDLRTGLVRKEWDSLDHVALDESHASPLQASAQWPFDYFHINTVNPHENGTTLISARNTWTLYQLSSTTGQILWKAGSKHGGVRMAVGTQTAYQHDATELPNGLISVFDNGGVPDVHPQTRGITVAIDPGRGTDTLIASYEHPTPLHAGSQGDIQVMPNGNVFMGWGAEPYFSEFTSSGQLLFDAHMPAKDESYRAYRSQWTGTPIDPPAIAVSQSTSTSPVTVYASWNGATGVASWRVSAGPAPDQLTLVASARSTGFETAIATPGPEPYVVVQALDEAGIVMSTSDTIKG